MDDALLKCPTWGVKLSGMEIPYPAQLIWILPGNYYIFIMAMLFYPCNYRRMIIIVAAYFCRNIYIHIKP